jgi:transposase InsO family protein
VVTHPAPPGPLPPQSSPCHRVVAEVLAVFTDRGSEFTSAACMDVCDRLGLRRPWGRIGSCLDKRHRRAIFVTLKVELVDRQHHRTRAEARASIFRCGGERVTHLCRGPWDRRWWPDGDRSLAVRPPTLETASAK